jgi:hypothetical protein
LSLLCYYTHQCPLLSQPYFDKSVRMRLTLPKWELGSPPGLPKLQSSISGIKTPRIGAFFISLESYRSVDVENGLAWAIWTFATQVMAKRKVKSQTSSLTPNHKKSKIDPTPMRTGGLQHTVGKLSTRATTLLETSSQSEVWVKSYSPAKLWKSKTWQFRTPLWESWDKKPFRCRYRGEPQRILYGGKVVASPELKPWWVLWVQSRPWLVLALKVL